MSYVDEVYERVVKQNPGEAEFHQAVKEVLDSLRLVIDANEEKYRKINRKLLPKGTVIRAETGGGGGYGDPAARDPEKVRADVESGYITPQRAKEVYGVTL